MRLALKSASFHLRNLRTRLPFRYGVVTLTHFPLLHLAVEVEAADGRRGRGFAADNLPPKWFDKDPTKTFRDNVEDQLASIRAAHEAYLEAARTPRPVFDIWLEAYAASRGRCRDLGLNTLTASFGSSLFERALADAAGRLAGLDVEAPAPADWPRIAELVERYGDFPLGGTDASVVALAERLDTDLVITLDVRHFGAVRPRHCPAFRLLPE